MGVQLARGSPTLISVNERFDIALSSRAHGVHLPVNSFPADLVRKVTRDKLLVGVSTHSLGEALAAERKGADYILLGPIFRTASKLKYGPPLGVARLAEVVAKCTIPVLAVGGINLSNHRKVIEAGARGIAAISFFANSDNLQRDVRRLRDRKR